jgi:hypothetical protein
MKMKKTLYTCRKWVCGLFTIFLFLSLYSCSNENIDPPVIYHVRSTNNPDSTFTASVPGAVIIIHGKGFSGIQHVYFNGVDAPINLAFTTDEDVIISIPATTPLKGTAVDITNQIQLVTTHGETIYNFDVKAGKPSISSISNEMAKPGSVITIFGSNLLGIKSITFPGSLSVSNFTNSKDGTSCLVTVPANLTQSGEILLETESGVVSYKGFRDKSHIICNFDDKSTWGAWGSAVTNSSSIYTGENDGNFAIMSGSNLTIGDWNIWGSRLIPLNSSEWIPASEMSNPISDYALKFEIRIPGNWNSGAILVNANGGWNYIATASPWYINKQRTSFVAPQWTTVTIPITSFKQKSVAVDKVIKALDGWGKSMTLWSDILDKDGKASVQIYFVNQDASSAINEINSVSTPIENFSMAFDNFRIVKIN